MLPELELTRPFLSRPRAGNQDAIAPESIRQRVAPQVPARPTGMLFGLKSSFHPFVAHPTFRAMSGLSLAVPAKSTIQMFAGHAGAGPVDFEIQGGLLYKSGEAHPVATS